MDSEPSAFSPGLWLQRLLRLWVLLVAFGIIGAVIGFSFSRLRPPVYQSEAVLAIAIDYGRTQPLQLIVEDRALDRVYQLLVSDAVMASARERLLEERGPEGAWEDVARLRRSLRLEQRLSDWHLIAWDPRPEVAAAMAEAWGESALAALSEAYQHAWAAAALQGQAFDVECFTAFAATPGGNPIDCLTSGTDLAPDEIERLLAEVDASHGILPALTFEVARSPVVPSSPSVRDQGQLTMAGALLGLLLGIAVIALAESRRARRSSPDPR